MRKAALAMAFVISVVLLAGCASKMMTDGHYAVLPWDTYPEFGKTKPVDSCTMSLKENHGKIKIAYEDGTSCLIDVQVGSTHGDLWFSYSFPSHPSADTGTIALRKTGGFLEVFNASRWVRFAKKIHHAERIDYPRWGELSLDGWLTPYPMMRESERRDGN